MPILEDWSQRQQKILEEYEQSPDRFGRAYDELFSKLIWTDTAASWEDFLAWIGELKGSWCFRGQRESVWTFQTSLDRSVRVRLENVRVSNPDGGHFIVSSEESLDRRDVESRLLSRFRQQAHQFIPNTPPDEDKASWFALMQHYGAPTRLLDWTWSPYIALYFALEDKPQQKNPEKEKAEGKKDQGSSAVWAMDIDWLETKKRERLESIPPAERDGYLSGLLEQRGKPLVVKIKPLEGNERMSAQQGFFLWNLYETTPFFDQILISMMKDTIKERQVIRKLEVGEDLRIEFLERLQSRNIHRGSLFPGLDGFCEFLKRDLEIEVAKEVDRKRRELSGD